MTTFMEQVVDSPGWSGITQDGSNASLDKIREGHCSPDGPLAEAGPALRPADRSSFVDAQRETRRRALLTRVVEAEILPRLAQIRRDVNVKGADGTPLTTEDDTLELVRLLLTQEAGPAVAYIDVLRRRGATLASLYLGIMTQAARHLGELWDQDRCDFAQVTISTGRLQQVLRALSPHFQVEAVRRPETESVLLVPAPGEQHTFGLTMLAEYFMREGWHVAGGPVTSALDAASIARGTWFDVAGFSIGSLNRLDALAQCIRAVRRASHNPDLYVMVGGPLFLTQPDLVARVGADSAATDAASAVRQARGLRPTRAPVGKTNR